MTLTLRFFGRFQALVQDQPIKFATDYARALLAYLTVEERSCERLLLVTLLWPGQPETSARQSLRQTLLYLRQALGNERSEQLLVATTQSLYLQAEEVDVDVLRFQRLLNTNAAHAHSDRLTCPACIERLKQAMDLYQGEFLQGFFVKGSQPFEEWALFLRERLHRQALEGCFILAQHFQSTGDYGQMQHYAARQLAWEPWREEAHRQMIWALAANGQRSAALAQYNRCCQLLAQELQSEPSRETIALYDQIRIGNFLEKESSKEAEKAKDVQEEKTISAHSLIAPLPLFSSPLIGRDQALAEINQQLEQPGVRLLTLVGPGGMGKTRLAVEVGRRRQMEFATRVLFVPLAAVTTPEALAPTLVTALGLTLQGNDPLGTLLHSLRHEQLLLILDNFEQLLLEGSDATLNVRDLLLALLDAAPGLQMLVTSRERLKLRAEHLYHVQALTFSQTASLVEAEALPSVRLFVQSVQRVQSNFQLTSTNLVTVLRICQLVQGMPLGLELAAANADTLPLSTLAAAIAQSGEVLAVDWYDLPKRQRSTHAVFAWSWHLLSREEQRILSQISLFRGGFDYKAAQAVTHATLALLARFCHKSLLQWQETETGEGRYLMHELLRQFASEQLTRDESADSDAARQRYAFYYLEWISQLTANVLAHQRSLVNAALQDELENCRQAWSLAVQKNWIKPISSSLAGFVYLWRKAGHITEGEVMLQSAIQAFSSSGSKTPEYAPSLAVLLNEQAGLLYVQTKYEQALRAAQQAWQLAERVDDPLLQIGCLLRVSVCANYLGDPRIKSYPFAKQALDLARQHNLRQWEAKALLKVCDEYGEMEKQIQTITDALNIAQELADFELEISALAILSGTFENYGLCARALPYRQHLVDLVRAQGDASQLVLSLKNHGNTYRFLGCYSMSLSIWKQALSVARQHHLDWLEMMINGEIAYLHSTIDDLDQAYHLIVAVRRQLADSANDPSLLDYQYAHILARRGELAEARRIAQQLLARLRPQAVDYPPHILRSLNLLVQIHWQSDALSQALIGVNEIVTILESYPRITMPIVEWELFDIYFTCYQVLERVHDPRATVLLANGYSALQSQANSIENPELHQAFLENIPAHRKLVAAWHARQNSFIHPQTVHPSQPDERCAVHP